MSKYTGKLNNLRETISMLIDSHVNNINTCILAKVVEVTAGSPYVKVSLLGKKSYLDENDKRVYVQYEDYEVRMAYQKGLSSKMVAGDYGIVMVMQSDIEVFIGGEEDSPRKYDLEDAIFVPLAYVSQPNVDNLTISTVSGEDITITSGKDLVTSATKTDITTNKLKISNGTDDLTSVLADLCSTLSTLAVNVSTGVILPNIAADINAIKTKIEAFVDA